MLALSACRHMLSHMHCLASCPKPTRKQSSRLRSVKMSKEGVTVVIDAGSQTTKAGFSGESFPRAVLPTTVARFRHPGLFDGYPIIASGKEAIKKRGISNLTWPVQDGLILDWEEMEKLWYHIFYKELHVASETSQIMYSVHPLISGRDKEKIAEYFFESFAIEGLYLMKSPVLVLHASGRTTGVVWENGSSCSYATPVFEGYPLENSTNSSPITGQRMTMWLQKLLAEAGYSFTTAVELDILDKMKAECCYVAKDFEEEIESASCKGDKRLSYKLPDGQKILLGEERFRCPELMFRPTLDGVEGKNAIDLICTSVSQCDIDYQPTFYENIVMGGGSSLFPGLADRLQSELTYKLRSQPVKPKIDTTNSRQYAAWNGGSLLSSLSIYKGFWMTRQEYYDAGAERVHYKFF